jgi:ubiquinone biosynthesis protein
VQRVVMKRLDLSRAGPEAMTLILGLQAFVNEVPSQMNQLLVDLSTGRFQVSVQGEAVNEVASAARTHGVRLVLSVLSASLILGTAITLAPFKFVIPRTQIPLVPVLLVLGLFVTGSGLGLSFLFPKGFQKIRLTRFLFWRRR